MSMTTMLFTVRMFLLLFNVLKCCKLNLIGQTINLISFVNKLIK